jgi:hypothetical protein
MLFRLGFLFFTITALISCGGEAELSNESNETKDSISNSSTAAKDSTTLPGDPIWGYRFVLEGDFDGNGVQDTLIERFMDLQTKKETNKFFTDLPLMDHQIYDGKERQVKAYLEDKSTKIAALEELGSLGIYFGEVIGDINGDGGDEVGIVGYDAYPSNLNTYRIFSYNPQTEKWEQLFDFGIREMSLPQLPGYNKVYGLFGSFDEYEVENEEANQQLEKELKAYKKVKIVSPKRIEFEGMLPNDLGYAFDEAFLFQEKYDESKVWLTAAQPKTGKHIIYHRVLEALYQQTMEEAKKDSFTLDPTMEYVQQVKFR